MLLYTAFLNSAFAFLIVLVLCLAGASSAKLHLLCVFHPDYPHYHDEGHAAEYH